jgi:hypothetical protein
MEQVVTSAVPLGRMGDKADIALACVYLASSAGRWGGSCQGSVKDGHAWVCWMPESVSFLSVNTMRCVCLHVQLVC